MASGIGLCGKVGNPVLDVDLVALDPWQGIYVALRNLILAGEYAPGERLVESELANRFRTSRGPVRSALKELERQGLVVIAPRRGTFVRTLSQQDVEEILSLWELMWSFAARRAIERITSADLSGLRAMVDMVPPDDEPELLLEYSVMFHRRVFQIANHTRALEIFDSLVTQAQSRLVMLMVAGHWRDVEFDLPADELCKALADGDVDAAIEISCRWSRDMGDFLLGHAHTDADDDEAAG